MKQCLLILLLLILCQCASYNSKVKDARNAYLMGHYEVASEKLTPLAEEQDRNELLYLMDLGMIYHTSGQYERAIKAFLKADKLAEIKDYTSVSEEVVGVVLNDTIKPYKGEHFEKILINTYLAMDFALLGKWESALVEARRVNHKLGLLISEGEMPYERNAFAKVLAGSLFEAEREYNNALVDYRQAEKWFGAIPFLGAPLLRLCQKLSFTQELAYYRKKFPQVKDYKIGPSEAEIIVLLEVGNGPIKTPDQNFRLLPQFRKQPFDANHGKVRVGRKSVRTETLYDIEKTAFREHEAKKAMIVAKKVGGIVAKEVIAHQVEKQTKSELAGALTRLAFYLTDRADLRSWSTLPAKLQMARITVPSGIYQIDLDMVMNSGHVSKSVKQWKSVKVNPGQKLFLNHRFME